MNARQTRLPIKEDFVLLHPVRVRWSEVDAQRVVFYANYSIYFDLGLKEYTRAIGFPFPKWFSELGIDIVVASSRVNFHKPAMFDDELQIGARIARIGTTSLHAEFAVFREDELLTDGLMICIAVTLRDRVPTEPPRELIDRVIAFERRPPDRNS
jgi:acyl-CoA thioester hydrolase